VVDNKFVPFTHPAFVQTADGKGTPYVHEVSKDGRKGAGYQMLGPEALEYYGRLEQQGKPVFIDQIFFGELEVLSEMELEKRFLSIDEKMQKDKLDRELDYEIAYAQETENNSNTVEKTTETSQEKKKQQKESHRKKLEHDDSIINRMMQWQYSKEQKEELHKMMALEMPKETILAVFYPETGAEKLRELRKTYQMAQQNTTVS